MRRIILTATAMAVGLLLAIGQENESGNAQTPQNDGQSLALPGITILNDEQIVIHPEDSLRPQNEAASPVMALMSTSGSSSDFIPQVIPPSPQSQVFTQYIDHPVTEYHGLAEIAIPLYEIKTNGLTIPIALNYHAGGIKYSYAADRIMVSATPAQLFTDGEMGAGWSMSAGGYRVSRSVHGKPDEFFDKPDMDEINDYYNTLNPNLYQQDSYFSQFYYYGIGISRSPFDLGGANALSYDDGAYDIFTYNLPASNGHFLLDENKQPYIIERNLDLINITEADITNVVWSLGITKFNITDVNGNTYYSDGEAEWAKVSYPTFGYQASEERRLNVGWPVNRIETAFGENINIEYIALETLSEKVNEQISISDAPVYLLGHEHSVTPPYLALSPNSTHSSSVASGISRSQSLAGYKQLFVSRILTDSEEIIFTRNTDTFPAHLLENIIIKDKSGNVIRKIEFEYDIATRERWHTLLKEIKITNQDAPEEVYSLDYYLPSDGYGSYMADQWGLHARKRPMSQLPALHQEFRNYEMRDKDILLSDIQDISKGMTNINNSTAISGQFAYYLTDRTADNSEPQFFSLKKIIYPTGGSAEYIYEPHKFFSASRSGMVTGGGQRIKKIISSVGDDSAPIVTEYRYGEEENGLGSANIDINPNFFSTNSANVHIYEYEYGETDVMGVLFFHSGGGVVRVGRTFFEQPIVPEASQFKVRYQEVSKYTYPSGNAGINSNGKTKSYYSIPTEFVMASVVPPITSGSNFFIYSLFNRGVYDSVAGDVYYASPLLSKREIYRSDGELVQAEEMTYERKKGSRDFQGIKVAEKLRTFLGGYMPEPETGYPNDWGPFIIDYIVDPYIHEYGAPVMWTRRYQIHSDHRQLTERKVTSYLESEPVEVTETYTYDDDNRLTSKSQTNNDGGIATTAYVYAGEEYTALMNKNMRETIINAVNSNNGSKISDVRYNYAPTGIQPTDIQTTGSDDAYRTDIQFTYDDRGNIIQYTTADGVNTAYIWGYNYKYPVAEIKGCTYDRIEEIMSSFTLDDIAGSAELSQNQINLLDALRPALSDALVTTLEYQPLVGVTKITDPTGRTTEYVYDGLGRLAEIMDDSGNLLEAYSYNYVNGGE